MTKKGGYTFFWKDKIAQWNMTPFYESGIKFNCAEQFMMAEKALLFKDQESFDKIMQTPHPKYQQKLGREVKNFNEKIWNDHKFNIVVRANILKFTQNEILRNILLKTGDTILVEASPYDRVWGVGLGVDDPNITDETKWQGQNLLGQALMEVRKICKQYFEG